MIVKSWLPERRELLTPNLHWLISLGEQNAIERALQSPNPSAQGRGAPNSKADKQMNMIRHDHVSADANANSAARRQNSTNASCTSGVASRGARVCVLKVTK